LPEPRPAEVPKSDVGQIARSSTETPKPGVADRPPKPRSRENAPKLAGLGMPAATPQEMLWPTPIALAAAGADARPVDPIEQGPCTVLDPVTVLSLDWGKVSLTGRVILNDRMVETLAKWAHDDLQPAASVI